MYSDDFLEDYYFWIVMMGQNIFSHCSDLNNNQIARIVKPHFQDSPLSGNIYLQNNAIAYIEPGSFSHVTSTGDLYVLFSIAQYSYCDFKKEINKIGNL